jgi:glutathione S-transferase
MALTLYYHPFCSFGWKVLILLYEAGTPFTPRRVDEPEAAAEWKRRWPIARFPVLVDEASGLTLPEASIIIEYLDSHYPGAATPAPHRAVRAARRAAARPLFRQLCSRLDAEDRLRSAA